MLLYDARKRYPKDLVYDTYIRIVYEFQEYDNITRKQMLNEIVNMYNFEKFMFHMCTKREIDFMSKFYKKELKINDLKEYSWEIEELDKKYIFNKETLSFYEDYDDIIPEVIQLNKKQKNPYFPLQMFIVAYVRIFGECLSITLSTLCQQIYNVDEEGFERFLGCPLVNFYCDIDEIKVKSGKERTIYYRDYYDCIEELREKRKVLGVASSTKFDIKLYEDFYYYGFNYSNPKVKRMYDYIMNSKYGSFMFHIIDECRVLNNPLFGRLLDSKGLEYVDEALYEIPCAAMNGVSPKQRDEILMEEYELYNKFSCIPQNDAHVHKDIVKKFYYYYFALLEYTNKKYKIVKSLKKIFKQEGLNPYDISLIEDYLWEHKEIIDDFINENPFKFNENDFYYINQFKSGLKDNNYVFVGTTKEYAKLLSSDGKIYMVKGLNCNIDKILNINKVPFVINTHLLMFENNIIFTGLISENGIDFGIEFKKIVLDSMKSAMEYYHL